MSLIWPKNGVILDDDIAGNLIEWLNMRHGDFSSSDQLHAQKLIILGWSAIGECTSYDDRSPFLQ